MSAAMRNVFSSHADKVGHDEATGEMIVHWKPRKGEKQGKVSAYAGVSAQLVDEIARSPSVGTRIHNEIKNNPAYTHRYVE